MKISDFIYRYQTYNQNDSLCRVRIFNNNNQVYALVTDIGNLNPSSSVTNSIENIIISLKDKGLVPESTCFIEHYEDDHSFDFVSLDINNKPSWKNTSLKNIKKLLNCSSKELKSLINNESKLMKQIDRLRYKIDSKIDFAHRKDSDIINRIEDIKKNMITKKEITKLIKENNIEQNISKKLKNDLSIFAEIYASPKNEYICFSEFPIGEGFVDYVVFTGRSRMNVYLIEVKGADFNFLNANRDTELNKNIENATRQIEKRLGLIHRRYEEFRQKFHRIREKVERGETKYNSFKGPISKLMVDSDKDVSVYGVIIGGRSTDDHEESIIKNNFEFSRNISIKLETWDSWIRKLSRN